MNERLPSLRFGVEVELVGLATDDAARVLDNCLGAEYGRCEGWKVVADASIPNGFELRSPPLRVCDVSLLERVFGQLRRAGGEPSPGHAGLHVHVETRDFAAQQLANLAVMWSAAEPALRQALDVHPRRALRYCRPIAPFARGLEGVATIGDLREHWAAAFCEDAGSPAKQRSLNLETHERQGTVEFRLFNSVATKAELRACVAVALGFADRARRCGASLSASSTLGQKGRLDECPPGGQGAVALVTDHTSFRAPTFRRLLQLLLDASFIDDEGAGWFEQRAKGETDLDRRAAELHGDVGAPVAEAYARAAVERLADRGCGALLSEAGVTSTSRGRLRWAPRQHWRSVDRVDEDPRVGCRRSFGD